MRTCKQNGCTLEAAYRYTWPGRDESMICEAHAGKLLGVAIAIGLHLQVIPLEPETNDEGASASEPAAQERAS